jgi:hypothetical protein
MSHFIFPLQSAYSAYVIYKQFAENLKYKATLQANAQSNLVLVKDTLQTEPTKEIDTANMDNQDPVTSQNQKKARRRNRKKKVELVLSS